MYIKVEDILSSNSTASLDVSVTYTFQSVVYAILYMNGAIV